MISGVEFYSFVKEGLDKHGTSIFIRKKSNGTYNPETGMMEGATEETPVKALVRYYDTTELSENIHTNDIEYRFQFDGELGYNDEILYSGKVYKVINIKKMILQDNNLLYTVQGRA